MMDHLVLDLPTSIGTLQRGLVVVGPSGCGKSTFLRQFFSKFPADSCFGSGVEFDCLLDSYKITLMDDIDSIEDCTLLINAIDCAADRRFLCTCTSIDKVDKRLIHEYRLGAPFIMPPLSVETRSIVFSKLCDHYGANDCSETSIRLAMATRNYSFSDVMKFSREVYYTQHPIIDVQDALNRSNTVPASSGFDDSSLITTITTIPELVNMKKVQSLLLKSIYAPYIATSDSNVSGQRCSSGFVVHGASGTGKSVLVQWLAGVTCKHFKLVSVSCSDLVHKVVGETEKYISRVFDFARRIGPTILWLDNLDSILPSRNTSEDDGNDSSKSRRGQRTALKTMDRLLSTLLVEIDGLGNFHQNPANNSLTIFESSSVVVIVTVNKLSSLDRSLLRPGRLEEHVELSLPNQKQRRKYLGHIFGSTVKSALLDELAGQCIDRSYAELKEIHQSAEFSWLKSSLTRKDCDLDKTRFINTWIDQKLASQR